MQTNKKGSENSNFGLQILDCSPHRIPNLTLHRSSIHQPAADCYQDKYQRERDGDKTSGIAALGVGLRFCLRSGLYGNFAHVLAILR